MERLKRTDKKQLQKLESWILNDAVEFWSRRGIEPGTGAGVDRLDASGQADVQLRLIANQARLAYVFARAEMFSGVRGHQRLTRGIFDFVSRRGVSDDRSDGYLHSFDRQWHVVDDRYFLLDHCVFCIASLAAYAAYGSGADMRRASNILRWIERKFRAPDDSLRDRLEPRCGYSLTSQCTLIDSFLVFFESTRRPVWLAKALAAAEASQHRFADPTPMGIRLKDRCDAAWQQAPTYCEIDDQVEFVWLLCRAQRYDQGRVSWRLSDYWQYPTAQIIGADLRHVSTRALARVVKVLIAIDKNGESVSRALFGATLDELLNRIKQAPLSGYIAANADDGTTYVADLFEMMRICVAARLF